MRARRSLIPRFCAAVASSFAIAWISSILPARTPVDQASSILPLVLWLLMVIDGGWVRLRFAPLAGFLLAAATLIPDPFVRTAAIGVVFSTAMFDFLLQSSDGRSVPLRTALLVSCTTLLAARLIPLPDFQVAALATVLVALTLMLIVAVSREGLVPWHLLTLCLMIGMTAGDLEFGRVFLPLLLIGLIAGSRRSNPVVLLMVAGAALVVGKPAMPFLLAAVTAIAFDQFLRFSRRFARFDGSLEVRSQDPARRSNASMIAAGVILGLGAFTLGPYESLLLLLCAFTLVAAGFDLSMDDAGYVAARGLLFGMLIFLGWSGALLAGLFPSTFPAGLLLLALIALPFLLPSRIPLIVHGAGCAVLVALLCAGPLGDRRLEHSWGIALSPGQHSDMRIDDRWREIGVVISAAATGGLDSETVVGTVEMIDSSGRVYRRKLTLRDLHDWAVLRIDQKWRSASLLPRKPAPRLTGWGREAFLSGDGEIGLADFETPGLLRVTASPDLPQQVRIQLERVRYAAVH